jgi:hypothetical protein
MDTTNSMQNYYQITNAIIDRRISPQVVGYNITKKVVENTLNNLSSYFSSYGKHFGHKEERALFAGLENIVESPDSEISTEDHQILISDFRKALNKTHSKIIRINFVYDAASFVSGKENIEGVYQFLYEQLMVLKNPTWKADNDFRLNNPDARLNEYHRLIGKLKSALTQKYGLPIQ